MNRSETMRRIKSAGNWSIERKFRAALVHARVGGWSVQPAGIEGKPDIAFVGPRVAVFLDGCFWHGCSVHYRPPRTRRRFWGIKVRRNMERDSAVATRLASRGWKVFRVWEHDIADTETLRGIILRVARAADTPDTSELGRFMPGLSRTHGADFMWCSRCVGGQGHYTRAVHKNDIYVEAECERCGKMSRRINGIELRGVE